MSYIFYNINYHKLMQYTNEKIILLNKALSEVVKTLRINKVGLSVNKFGESYGIEKNNILRIEKAKGFCKLITIWQIANAFGLKFSDFIKFVEDKLGDDFTLIDE